MFSLQVILLQCSLSFLESWTESHFVRKTRKNLTKMVVDSNPIDKQSRFSFIPRNLLSNLKFSEFLLKKLSFHTSQTVVALVWCPELQTSDMVQRLVGGGVTVVGNSGGGQKGLVHAGIPIVPVPRYHEWSFHWFKSQQVLGRKSYIPTIKYTSMRILQVKTSIFQLRTKEKQTLRAWPQLLSHSYDFTPRCTNATFSWSSWKILLMILNLMRHNADASSAINHWSESLKSQASLNVDVGCSFWKNFSLRY